MIAFVVTRSMHAYLTWQRVRLRGGPLGGDGPYPVVLVKLLVSILLWCIILGCITAFPGRALYSSDLSELDYWIDRKNNRLNKY